jgi:hypothetical protein
LRGAIHLNETLGAPSGEQFDQETVRILGVAFEQVCIGLRTGDDDVQQAIANKIIKIAKIGERNPDLLCERALKGIRQEAANTNPQIE